MGVAKDEDVALLPSPIMPLPVPEREHLVFTAGKLRFRANFCSANLASAKEGALPLEFDLCTFQDNHGTPQQTGHRSWFYFGVSGHDKGDFVIMNICNMNNQSKLYSGDYRVHYRTHPGMHTFLPLRSRVKYTKAESSVLRFSHKFESASETFFAFCIPWSCEDNNRLIKNLLQRFAHPLPTRPKHSRSEPASPHGSVGSIDSESGTCAPSRQQCHVTTDPTALAATAAADSQCTAGIYFHCQTLARSLQGRPLHVLTITDMHGWQDSCDEPLLPGCFPEDMRDAEPPARCFPQKRVLFVSARVHPGETPASHLCNGMLLFLLRRQDPRARALRRLFVIKVVPLVNPDGVALGHFRVDTLGNNLNRFYADPCPRKQPGIYAIRSLLLHYAASGLLHVYLDLHAHANRQGVFAYGNALSGAAHLEALLFCKLAALNSPYFDFSGCNFSERNMASRDRDGTSKDGTGRVALHRASQLPLLYTVEANYNRSRHMPEVPAAAGGRAADASPVHAVRAPERFDAGTFHQVGRALLVSVLDLEGCNPWSRLPNSHFGTVHNLRTWMLATVKASGTKSVPNFPNVSEASQVSVRELPEARRVSAALATTMLRRSRSVINATSTPQPPAQAAPSGRPGAGRGSRSDAGVARWGRGRADGGDRATAPDCPTAGPRSRVTAQKRTTEQPTSTVVFKPDLMEGDGAVVRCGAAAPEEGPAGGSGGPETAATEELAPAVTMGDTPACSDSKAEEDGDDDFPEASDMEYDSGSEGVSERCSDTIETEAARAIEVDAPVATSAAAVDSAEERPKRPPTGPQQHSGVVAVAHAPAGTAAPPRASTPRAGTLMRGPAATASAQAGTSDAAAGLGTGQSSGSTAHVGRGLQRSLKGLELHGEALGGPDPVPPLAAARRSWPSGGRLDDVAAAARGGVESLVRAARDGLQGGFGVCSLAAGFATEEAAFTRPRAPADREADADADALRIVQLRLRQGDEQLRTAAAPKAAGSRGWGEVQPTETGAAVPDYDVVRASSSDVDRGVVQPCSTADAWQRADNAGGVCLSVSGHGRPASDGSCGLASAAGAHGVTASAQRGEQPRSMVLPFATPAPPVRAPASAESSRPGASVPAAPPQAAHLQTPRAQEVAPSPPRSRLHQSHSMPPAGERSAMRARSLRHRPPVDPETDIVHMRAHRGWFGILNPHGTQDSGGVSAGNRSGKAPPASGHMRAYGHQSRHAAKPVARFGRAGALQHAQHACGSAVGSMLFKGAPGAPPLPAAAVASLCAASPPERYQEHLRVAQARRARSEGAAGEASARGRNPAARVESISGALEMISSAVREAEGSLKQLW